MQQLVVCREFWYKSTEAFINKLSGLIKTHNQYFTNIQTQTQSLFKGKQI